MTAYQTQYYWRNWAAAVRTQCWGTVASIASAHLLRQQGVAWVSPDLDSILAEIWRFAEELVPEAGGHVTATELRHACHIVAVGHCASSKRFSNADFDCVLALFRLLADPNQVANVMAWQNRAELGERKRYIYAITRAQAAYWKSIASDKFGHSDLSYLTLAELRQLSLTIRERARSRAKRECETVQAVPV